MLESNVTRVILLVMSFFVLASFVVILYPQLCGVKEAFFDWFIARKTAL